MILAFIGVIMSFALYKTSCTPHCPLKWNQLKIGKTTLHLHHWLLSILLLPFAEQEFIQGLLVGSVIHGVVSYDDWHKIIY